MTSETVSDNIGVDKLFGWLRLPRSLVEATGEHRERDEAGSRRRRRRRTVPVLPVLKGHPFIVSPIRSPAVDVFLDRTSVSLPRRRRRRVGLDEGNEGVSVESRVEFIRVDRHRAREARMIDRRR